MPAVLIDTQKSQISFDNNNVTMRADLKISSHIFFKVSG